MVDVEEQNRFGIDSAEFIKGSLLPTLRELAAGIQILGKKSIFVRNFEEIEHCPDHVKMGYKDRLRYIGGELFVFVEPRPKARSGLPKRFRVQLVHMKAKLHALIELKSLELPNGHAAEQLFKR